MKEQNSMEFKEDLSIFLEEVEELLANTEENLVELEKAPSDEALVQEVFRAMHTIKGGAATLGFQDGVEVTHTMESILDTVRSRERKLTADVVDSLFLVLDWLSEWKVALETQSKRPSTQEIMKKIRGLEFGQDEGVASSKTACNDFSGASLEYSGGEVLGDPLGNTPGPFLAGRLKEALDDGSPVYKLAVRFRPETDLLSVRCFQTLVLVNEAVDVIGSLPSLEEVEAGEASDVLDIYIISDDQGMTAKRVAGSVQDVVQVSLVTYTGSGPGQSVGQHAGFPSGQRPGKSASQHPKQQSGHRAAGHTGQYVGQGKDSVPDTVIRKTNLGRTVRVDVGLLDFLLNTVGELVIDRTRLTQMASRLQAREETSVAGNEIAALSSRLQRASQELQEGIMRARLLPLNNIFTKFPRMIRDLSNRCGKQIDLEIRGEQTELDRTVIEAIDDPLIHILRNAVDHGIEMPEERRARDKPARGKVTLSAWHQENQVLVQVEDDGSGIDPNDVKASAMRKGLITEETAAKLSDREAVELIFMPGFSTSQVATQVSGRGVGMDVVRSNLERINGHIEVSSQVGTGTAVTLRLPLTLAIMRSLLVDCSGLIYAIPTSSVEEVLVVAHDEIKTVKGRAALTVRGRVFPLVSLEGCLKDDPWMRNGNFKYAVLTRSQDEPLALGVDGLIGEEEVVVKEMGKILSRLKGIAGATILPQGDPALILDTNRLL